MSSSYEIMGSVTLSKPAAAALRTLTAAQWTHDPEESRVAVDADGRTVVAFAGGYRNLGTHLLRDLAFCQLLGDVDGTVTVVHESDSWEVGVFAGRVCRHGFSECVNQPAFVSNALQFAMFGPGTHDTMSSPHLFTRYDLGTEIFEGPGGVCGCGGYDEEEDESVCAGSDRPAVRGPFADASAPTAVASAGRRMSAAVRNSGAVNVTTYWSAVAEGPDAGLRRHPEPLMRALAAATSDEATWAVTDPVALVRWAAWLGPTPTAALEAAGFVEESATVAAAQLTRADLSSPVRISAFETAGTNHATAVMEMLDRDVATDEALLEHIIETARWPAALARAVAVAGVGLDRAGHVASKIWWEANPAVLTAGLSGPAVALVESLVETFNGSANELRRLATAACTAPAS